MSLITVIKRNHQGEEVFRYSGRVIQRDKCQIVLEAFFTHTEMRVNDLTLRKGDRFIEIFYSDRWYNIFEIHDREDDHLKGWYCNIGYPAVIEDEVISYIDLALDLLVLPGGRQNVLDTEEFTQLALPEASRQAAWEALAELQALFNKNPDRVITQSG
jgi:protein associated with RNAse G/E